MFASPMREDRKKPLRMTWFGFVGPVELKRTGIGMVCRKRRRILRNKVAE
jgi:hypothetical protein